MREALVANAIASIPGRLSSFETGVFLSCVYGDDPLPAVDGRFIELYSSPLLCATLDWIGLHGVWSNELSDPEDPSFSASGISLSELTLLAEARFDLCLRSELDRFWVEAGQGTDPADMRANGTLRTPRNLALLWSLFTAAAFADLRMSRMDVTRHYLRETVALYRAAGFADAKAARDLDAWELADTWNSVFWFMVAFEDWSSLHTNSTSEFEPHIDFPEAPRMCPAEWFALYVPPLTRRPVGAPIPEPLRLVPDINSKQFYCWLDPLFEIPAGQELVVQSDRDRVLDFYVTKLNANGILGLGGLLAHLGLKVHEYLGWLKNSAGITMMDIIVATDVKAIVMAGQPPPPLKDWGLHLLRNPLTEEAGRRYSFLKTALEAIAKSLPPGLAAAADASDPAALASEIPNLSPPMVLALTGYLSHIRELGMVLSSPELFAENPAKEASSEAPSPTDPMPSSSTLVNSSVNSSIVTANSSTTPPGTVVQVGDYDQLMDFWFSSPSFRTASQHAIAISSLIRRLLDTHSIAEIKSNLFSVILCYSATHATWLHLLVLRRFRSLISAATQADMAKAAAVYEDIRSDIQACLDMLEAVGNEAHQAARVLLQDLFDGRDGQLSRAELGVLRAARKLVRRCPHVSGAMDGHCWLCAAGASAEEEDRLSGKIANNLGQLSLEESGAGSSDVLVAKPLRRFASLAADSFDSTSSSPNAERSPIRSQRTRRVRFESEVEICETYSAAEYPARSMLSPFDPELEAPPKKPTPEATEGLLLSTILQQRDPGKLPDLARFW